MRRALLGLLFLFFSWVAFGVETVVIVEEPSAAKAVDMVRTGALDLYGAGVTDPELLRRVRAELSCLPAYTAVWFLSLNPAGPILRDGKLNPFAILRPARPSTGSSIANTSCRSSWEERAYPRFCRFGRCSWTTRAWRNTPAP